MELLAVDAAACGAGIAGIASALLFGLVVKLLLVRFSFYHSVLLLSVFTVRLRFCHPIQTHQLVKTSHALLMPPVTLLRYLRNGI